MSLRVYYEVLNQKGSPALFTDTFANRPAFGFQGRLFISTDTAQIFEDTGSAWTLIADATGSTIGFVPYSGAINNLNLGSFNITASSLIKSGGTSAQILAADGSVITAGTNITISGGTISSSSGGIGGSGTTNTLSKFTGASTIGNSNITDSGTLITLGSSTTISNGGLGIGTTFLTDTILNIAKNITGATTFVAVRQSGVVQSDANLNIFGFNNIIATQVASFNVNQYIHYNATQGTIGAGSSVTTNVGFNVSPSMIGGANNIGFRGLIPVGTNRWNLYMEGTAANYFAGVLNIGTTALSGFALDVNGTARVTGAASFSSSVTATGGLISNGGAIGYGGGELGFGITTAGATSSIYTLATGSPILYFDHRGTSNAGFWVWRSGTAGGTTALTLSNVGAASFSSSVTATGEIITASFISVTNIESGVYANYFGPYSTGATALSFIYNSTGSVTWNNGSEKMNLSSSGTLKITTLAGTGSRNVLADSSGNLSAPVSDISVKQNISTIGYGLNEILKMNPVWFDFINDYKNYGEGRQNGNIAQEMIEIIPEAVFTTPSTGKMGINYDQLHAVYIKAIQELNDKLVKNNIN